MVIRNKKTGKTLKTANIIVGEGEDYISYSSLDELNNEWEDV